MPDPSPAGLGRAFGGSGGDGSDVRAKLQSLAANVRASWSWRARSNTSFWLCSFAPAYAALVVILAVAYRW